MDSDRKKNKNSKVDAAQRASWRQIILQILIPVLLLPPSIYFIWQYIHPDGHLLLNSSLDRVFCKLIAAIFLSVWAAQKIADYILLRKFGETERYDQVMRRSTIEAQIKNDQQIINEGHVPDLIHKDTLAYSLTFVFGVFIIALFLWAARHLGISYFLATFIALPVSFSLGAAAAKRIRLKNSKNRLEIEKE